MPPETVNSAVSSRMKGMYSASSACTKPSAATAGPKVSANGTRNASAQAAAILPKWWCQNCGATSGQMAIDSRMPTKGTAHSTDSWLPSSDAACAGAACASSISSAPRRLNHRDGRRVMVVVAGFMPLKSQVGCE